LLDLYNNQLIHINPYNATTHFCEASGKYSCIDLTFLTPELALIATWDKYLDRIGSDHYAQIIDFQLHIQRESISFEPKWKLKNADWTKYREEISNSRINEIKEKDINKLNEKIKNVILDCANKTVRKTRPIINLKLSPWMTHECMQSKRERNRAENQFQKHRTEENKHIFNVKKKETAKLIFKAKENNWHNFCSTLNDQSNSKEVWNKINAIRGENTDIYIPALIKDGKIATSTIDKAELLKDNFVTHSNSDNYSEDMQLDRPIIEENIDLSKPPSQTAIDEHINKQFTLHELETVVNKKVDKATGADTITYRFIKELPITGEQAVLS